MGENNYGFTMIHEETFVKQMQQEAVPYLQAHKKARYLQRIPGEKLYTECYLPQKPQAVVVISHGFTESIHKYDEMIYYFLQAGYAVYIMEHCGHGRSYRLTKDPSKVHVDCFERYRDDFLLLVRTAKEAYPQLPLFLFGHSMGGGIALAAAARDSALFAKIAVSAPMIRPLTGGIPWGITQAICAVCCHTGREEKYVIGQGPFRDDERYEDSATQSRPRFDYYHGIRSATPQFWLSGASYGWLYAAGKLSDYLLREGWKHINAPVLLFQAEKDDFVDNQMQTEFIRRLHRRRDDARLMRVPGTKHEIFNSHDRILAKYLRRLFGYFETF